MFICEVKHFHFIFLVSQCKLVCESLLKQITQPHKEILDSPDLRIPLIDTRNKKDKTLESPTSLFPLVTPGTKDKLMHKIHRGNMCAKCKAN